MTGSKARRQSREGNRPLSLLAATVMLTGCGPSECEKAGGKTVAYLAGYTYIQGGGMAPMYDYECVIPR